MSYANTHVNVAMLTAGGLAPCLSSSVAALTEHWVAALKAGKISGLSIRMYTDGYKGLLQGESFVVADDVLEKVAALHDLGGSPIGNSRVKVSSLDNMYLEKETSSYAAENAIPLEHVYNDFQCNVDGLTCLEVCWACCIFGAHSMLNAVHVRHCRKIGT